jgi:8-oxo-dGTP pyrophosphatase MutT (NUDIX family)
VVLADPMQRRNREAAGARRPLCQQRSPPGLTSTPGGHPNHHETDL